MKVYELDLPPLLNNYGKVTKHVKMTKYQSFFFFFCLVPSILLFLFTLLSSSLALNSPLSHTLYFSISHLITSPSFNLTTPLNFISISYHIYHSQSSLSLTQKSQNGHQY